ncbi:transposase [Xanthomonas arboricola]|uniref:transposase n=1 Tax=Xanthomonas arboricola TaxID=56448 RepID=UPI00208FEF1E|nr:transposase [Xanthomonas arboricola]
MHVIQRGVNRCEIFLDDEDRHHYCLLLRMACERFAVRVHAFVLMDNHVHLLVSADRVGAVSSAIRLSGQSYVQAFNVRHQRSGTLWLGARFKPCLVQTEGYVLTVLRYIALNPLRARMMALPAEYRWSRVHTHLGVRKASSSRRARSICIWAAMQPSGCLLCKMASCAFSPRARTVNLPPPHALGDPRFQAMVERALDRPMTCCPRGRPDGENQMG